MRPALGVLAILLLAGCVTGAAADSSRRDAAELADALKGRVAGPPQKCIQQTRLDGPMIIGDTILYRDGGRLWRTEAVDGCIGLRGDPLLVVETYGGRLCQNDRFQTIMRGAPSIPGPYCRFGAFTPYTKTRG